MNAIKIDTAKLIMLKFLKIETEMLALEIKYLESGDLKSFKEASEKRAELDGIQRFYDATFTGMDKRQIEPLIYRTWEYKTAEKKYHELWNQHWEMKNECAEEWEQLKLAREA